MSIISVNHVTGYKLLTILTHKCNNYLVICSNIHYYKIIIKAFLGGNGEKLL